MTNKLNLKINCFRVKNLVLTLGLVLVMNILYAQQPFKNLSLENNRVEEDMNTDWTFNYFPEGYKGNGKYPGFNDNRWSQPDAPVWKTIIEHPGFDDSEWSSIAIPHTWSTYETTGELHPYIKNPSPKDDPYWWNGTGWYRKKFSLDKKYTGKKVFAEFEGVQKNCRVYINGKIAGEHFGGYTGFSIDLTDYINYGEENVLVVAVSNMMVDGYKVAPMDGGCWNVYGGIYRPVKLVLTDKLYIPYQGSSKFDGGTFITSPVVSLQKAEVRVRTWVKNEYQEPKKCKLTTQLVDKNGKTVAEISETKTIQPGITESFDQTINLQEPFLWSVETPELYQANSKIAVDGQITDVYKSTFGIRKYRWDFETNTLYVNDQKVNLHGFNRHQEYPWLGDAIPDFIHEMDLRDMKENLNCNFVRPGQYITAPYVYDLCDQMGLITCGEFPNVKDLDFSFEMQEMYARELVRQYRNHPSIFLWDIGDETNRPADSRWVREEDAERYITCRDCAGLASGKFIDLPSEDFRLAKMLRCTTRGWYDDDDKNFRPENQQHSGNEQYEHEVARTGKDGTSNNRIDQPNLIVWLYEDHGCDREYQNAPLLHYNPKGWVDSYRVPKFVYYLWQANYTEKPMAFIHPQFWRQQYVGQKKDIEVDSNCESVELLVNGRSQGVQKPTAENFHVVKFNNVPIEKGTLTVKGTKNSQPITKTLRMAEAPASLKLTTAQKSIDAMPNSVAIVTADITDLKGEHVYGARNTITWEISGPATLVGASVYESDFDKNMEMEGALYIDMPVSNVIRSTGQAGRITVRAFAAGLSMGEIELNAVAKPVEPKGITQTSLRLEGRVPVLKNPNQKIESSANIPQLIKDCTSDAVFKGKTINSLEQQLDNFLARENNTLDRKSNEYQSLISVLAMEGYNGKGKLVAEEINFNIWNFNGCAFINRAIDQTKLQYRFKSELKAFYILEIIVKGNPKNAGEEAKNISKLPVGTVVVVSDEKVKNPENGILFTESTDIKEIVSLVNRKFQNLNPTDQEVYLNKLSEINPWIKRSVYWTGDYKLNTKKEVIQYSVEKGKALLIPKSVK